MPLKSKLRLIPLSIPHMSDEGFDQQFVAESFATNYVASAWPMQTFFEYEVVQYIRVKHAAESLGSTYWGRHIGTFGDYGILSFNGNKIITSTSGGMVLSNNKKAIEQIRFWSTQVRDNSLY